MRTISVASLVVPVGVSLAAFAGCADEDASGDPPRDPDGGADSSVGPMVVDAGPDGERPRGHCEEGDPTCTIRSVPCSETDFCPVETGVEARYSLTGVWGFGAADVWIVGSAGTVARWDGTSFRPEQSSTPYTLNAIWGAGPDDLWAVGTPDVVLRRSGGAWAKATPIATGAYRIQNSVLRAVWGPRDGTHVVAGGDPLPNGAPEQLWGASPGKVRWGVMSAIPSFVVRGIWGTSAADVWTVGYVDDSGGAAFHRVKSEEGIEDWVSTDLQAPNTFDAIWGSGPSDVWAVGTHGTIRHFQGGTRWEVVESPTNQDLHAVWGSGPSDVWSAGNAGTLIHWDGVKWRRLAASFSIGDNPHLFGIWGSGPNDVWVVGESGIALHAAGVRTKPEGGGR